MKASGLHLEDAEGENHLPLREVDIIASRKMLRKLGKHLISASKDLKRGDHWHFTQVGDYPDFVVMLPDKQEGE